MGLGNAYTNFLNSPEHILHFRHQWTLLWIRRWKWWGKSDTSIFSKPVKSLKSLIVELQTRLRWQRLYLNSASAFTKQHKREYETLRGCASATWPFEWEWSISITMSQDHSQPRIHVRWSRSEIETLSHRLCIDSLKPEIKTIIKEVV